MVKIATPHKDNKKECTKCKKWLPFNAYGNDKNRWDGLYPSCKKCKQKEQQLYYLYNRDKMLLRNKEWRKKNASKDKYLRYKSKGFKHSFYSWLEITTQPCYYCGNIDLPCNGIDRVDSDKGYEIDNCVPCFWECNRMKNSTNKENFIKKCKQIVEKQEVMSYSK